MYGRLVLICFVFSFGIYKIMKNFWFKLSDKIRFCIIGVINAGICYLLYVLFIFIFEKGFYQLSLALAWIFSSITSFFTHRYLVFKGNGKILKEYFRCCTTWVFAYFINSTLLEIFVKFLKFDIYTSQILAPAIAGIFTYFAFKKLAFKKQNSKSLLLKNKSLIFNVRLFTFRI